MLIVYYPSNDWLVKSKFLNCNEITKLSANTLNTSATLLPIKEYDLRKNILFADLNNNNRREENEAIVVVEANNYQKTFNTKVPLNRMLRRQINNMEYIALTNAEFENIFRNNHKDNINNSSKGLSLIYFVIPTIKMLRGYYATEMKIVNMGKMKRVQLNRFTSNNGDKTESYTVYFKNKPAIKLISTKRFIRWLGL